MNIFGLNITLARKQATTLSINQVLERLEAAHAPISGVSVSPDTAMQSPTISAIVAAISKRISTLPVRVLETSTTNGRVTKRELPNHPVARLLNRPNRYQDRVSFWLDAMSWLVRYNNFYAVKGRGRTGPIRQLLPFPPSHVTVDQDPDTLDLRYRVQLANGEQKEYGPDEIMHARGAARDGMIGDSPINDIAEAIALEIAAEKMGAAVFGNGAMPGMVLKYAEGSQGHKTEEERRAFTEEFQNVYAKRGRFKALLLPKGIEIGEQIAIDNEKAQFLATRQYQRTVIAGAFGVPPHMVGDLTRGTFNNVEEQNRDFTQSVILPYARIFEAAMERALLSEEDRRNGVIVRFNLDGAIRANFKERQEGLAIQRQAGVISADDWRSIEDMNPIGPENGGDEYWRQGPSGQTAEAPENENPSGGGGGVENGGDDDSAT